jgi:AraC-like DNA-binding protein
MYCEYLPDIRLRHLIEAYWVSDTQVSSAIVQRILPDGCVDIIFAFDTSSRDGGANGQIPNIVGTITTHLDVTFEKGHTQMLGIRFHPAGITAFTRVPVYELTNKIIQLALAETLFDGVFYERLPCFSTMTERIKRIENYLLSKLPHIRSPEKRITSTIEYIRKEKGLVSLRQMADMACLSERQLERQFKISVGLTPKTFSRIIKFRHTLQYLKLYPQKSLYAAALECGYFDHSHLIKDFKNLGGTVPGALLL